MVQWGLTIGRFGKSTHISIISNSVTHLRSYTNSATADIAGNSVPILPATPVTPRDRRAERRRFRIERRYRSIKWPRNIRRRCPKRRRLYIERRYLRIEWQVFHNVLRVFHDVLLVFHDVLWCITMFYMCFNLLGNLPYGPTISYLGNSYWDGAACFKNF